MDISKARNFLLTENVDSSLDEMAKIKDELKLAIEKVISDNPEVEGLALKKLIKSDAEVEQALMGDTIYDNQLNKFIALKRGTRTVQPRGRKSVLSPKDKEDSTVKVPLAPSLETPEDIESSDPVTANNFRNIIIKKVNKIENMDFEERANSIDMQALKNFIQKQNVKDILGDDTIANLVSPIIG